MGVEPTPQQGLSLLALPVCVPGQRSPPANFGIQQSAIPGAQSGSRTHMLSGLSRVALPVGVSGRRVPGEGIGPPFSGSEPDGLPLADPGKSTWPVRGEGFEPSSPGSKPGSLPLADPRECPVGIEPTSDSLEDCRLRRSAKGTNISGKRGSRTLKALLLDRFRGGCHRQIGLPFRT